MKINDIHRIGGVNPYRKDEVRKPGESKGTGQSRKDEVQISSEAKELMASQMKDPARAEKLESLKQSVNDGTYKVDARKLAEKLLPYFKSNNDKQGE
jgi:negative regulator of flagellin synthesis FlgM